MFTSSRVYGGSPIVVLRVRGVQNRSGHLETVHFLAASTMCYFFFAISALVNQELYKCCVCQGGIVAAWDIILGLTYPVLDSNAFCLFLMQISGALMTDTLFINLCI